jgi:antitoxin (DNA-binding transcriptional repressor) of toxin-antitoxin stability system
MRVQIISDMVSFMKRLSVTEAARNFTEVINDVERDREEIILVRDRKTIARLVPELPPQNALEVFGDLYGTLDDKTADALTAAIRRSRKGKGKELSNLRNPWPT